MTGGDWRRWAVCRNLDPDLPFAKANTAEAEAFIGVACAVCPVSQECLSHAMRSERDLSPGSRFGVFGGLTSTQRGHLARYGMRSCADCDVRFIPTAAHNVRCAACRKARTTVPPPGPVTEHGTRPGYEQHQRRGEDPCEPCRVANNWVKWLWKQRRRSAA